MSPLITGYGAPVLGIVSEVIGSSLLPRTQQFTKLGPTAAAIWNDEAYSALDRLIRSSVQDLLLDLQNDLHKTVVFITHDLDEALKLADHLVILKDGEVIQQGEPQDILLNPADPYIDNFMSDINRARVLRVRSVMQTGPVSHDADEVISSDQTLEAA
ncbi:ABC-type proline/glycine betaine transport system ATPase subunit [Mesorhizobium robiniae]|uniref:ABC-type proline/glycine betaine transport system ATPase subunit n=1 Tax=Mesorhizobium robiniae TaxID=559315 RepID=A0ABV2GYS7_9HYPH